MNLHTVLMWFSIYCSFPCAKARVVFELEHDAGDHFASYKKPEVLVGDLRKMFSRTGPEAGIVSGCTQC